MTALALRVDGAIADNDNQASLVAIIDRVRGNLTEVRSSAQLLDDRAAVDFVYDTSKTAARLARQRGAHSEIVAKSHRLQADALEMRSLADIRLADEYDRAQERGEVATAQTSHKRPSWSEATGHVVDVDTTPSSLDEMGITRQEIYTARKLRDADELDPGFVRRELDALLEAGHEPTKAAVTRAVATRLNSFSGDNEWYTPARYVDMAREVMGAIDTDPASNPTAQRTVRATTYYTAETNGLDKEWHGKVWMNPPYSNPEVQHFAEKVIAEYQSGRVTEAIVLTNNSADTGWHRAMQDACTRMCTTTGRIRFESPTRQGNSPAMGQSFFYFGDNPERFKEIFSAIGNVWRLA